MGNNFKFSAVTGGDSKFKRNSEPWQIIEQTDRLRQVTDKNGIINRIVIITADGTYPIDMTADTVEIVGGLTYNSASNIDVVFDVLNPLFHKANTGTGGTGQIPNLQAVTSAGGQTSNPIYLQDADVSVLGDEGALLSSLSYDADGGIVTLKDVNTGFVATIHAPQGMTANRDVYVGEGGGGLTLESYQNSAMSAPVQAYVFRDAADNIMRVYEPVRNNDVSRFMFAYADSIDKFPFDSEYDLGEGVMSPSCFNNRVVDVKLIDIASDVKIQGCTLEAMVIDGNSHTGLQILSHNQKGGYGIDCPNGAEIFINGNNVLFQYNSVYFGNLQGYPNYFDRVPNDTVIQRCNFHAASNVQWVGSHTTNIWDCIFFPGSQLVFNDSSDFVANVIDALFYSSTYIDYNMTTATDNVTLEHSTVGHNSNVVVGGKAIIFTEVGNAGNLDSTGGSVVRCSLGDGVTYAPPADVEKKNIVKLNNVTYELGVTDGAVTATPV